MDIKFVNRPSQQFSGSFDSISATFSLQLERLFAHFLRWE